MTFIVPEKLKIVLKNFINGQFESCLSSLEEVKLGYDIGFLDTLRAETISVVCTFLSKASSCGQSDEDSNDILTALETFCVQLEKLLEKLRSLPPSLSSLEAELVILYNFGYSQLVKAYMLKTTPEMPSSLVQSILHSLNRVGCLLGFDSELQTCLQGKTNCLNQLFSALLELAGFLQVYNSQELFQQIQLHLCLCALMSLATKQLAPGDGLSPTMLHLDRFNKKVVMKHGYVVIMSPQLNLLIEQNDAGDIPEDGFLPSINSFASLVAALLAFQRKDWKTCKHQVSGVKYRSWGPLSSVLAAHSLLESGHCLETIDYLHKFLEDFTACTSVLVESIVYRLLAECYSRQGFHHLAVKTLHHSLKVNPNDIAALYAISQQYKTLQQTESEIECLHLYVKALEEEKDGGKQLCYLPLLEELLLDTVTHSSELSVGQAFYNFGSRLAELSRHSEASEWYMGLIQKYESKRHHSSCADHLPDFLTICQEASKNLLLANKHEECLFLCNKVLTAIDCGFMSGVDMCEEDFPVISFLEREDMEERQETRTSCQRKRRLSADRQDTEQEQLAWKRMKNSALVLACRADAEIMLGNCTAAVQDLRRAIDELLKYPHASKNAAAEICRSDFALIQSLTPQPKRPRQISDSEDDRESQLSVESAQSDDWSKMTSTICIKLADALSRQQEDRQALHFSRLAVQMCPGEESALYFLCSSLQRLNRSEEGYQHWLQSRSLPYHTGSVRVQTLLQQRQEELRSTACEVGRNTHHLGHVPDMDKIRLDVSCLQTLLSVRQGRLPDSVR